MIVVKSEAMSHDPRLKYLVRHVVLVLSHTLAAICPELQPLPYLIHMLHTDPEDP